MFCRNCGAQIDERAAICVHCGVKVGTGQSFCANCGQPTMPGAYACTNCGVQLNNAVNGGEQKSKLVAGLLGIFLGGLGIHRFYLGYTLIGVLQIVASLCFGAGVIWGLIEGICILCGVGITKDAKGNPLANG